MPFIKVKLIDGVFDHMQKQQIVTRLVEVMDSIDGKNPRSATWVVIEEVKLSELGSCANPLSQVARRPIDAKVRPTALAELIV
jgi:4-oxalocrotonate tautomerase family enzyme